MNHQSSIKRYNIWAKLQIGIATLMLIPPSMISFPSFAPLGAEAEKLTRPAVESTFCSSSNPWAAVTSADWIETGKQTGVLLGWSVASAGDVNGDGYADVIVGVPRYSHDQIEEGAAFLYTGCSTGLTTTPTWMKESGQEWAWFGTSVASAGDVNGDGYSDLIVGAPGYNGEQMDEGAAFVYYGSPTGPVTTTIWITNPTDQASARFGTAVASAEDVNGDGYADVIVTANGYDTQETNEGAVFVYYGSPTGLAADPSWIAHPTGQAYANFGRTASSAGDVNRDGYSDIIVGAPWYDNNQSGEGDEGAVFVYHGGSTGLESAPGWIAMGNTAWAEFGTSVSRAGDVNKDGYTDVIIGAYRYSRDQYREGVTYAYYGSLNGLGTSFAWSAEGNQAEAKFGLTVSTAGDINSDGYADVLIGAPGHDVAGDTPLTDTGHIYIYHGSSTGLATDTENWTATGDQQRAAHGFAVATAGDVNGDAYSDIIVGAPTYNDTQIDEGAALVYLGDGETSPPALARQMRPDGGGGAIAPLGSSYAANQVQFQLITQVPLEPPPLALQWQLAPLGISFTAASAISGTSPAWSDVFTTGTVISQTVDGLTGGTLYRWRVRLLYQVGDPVNQTYSRWMSMSWNGPEEADFRTPRLLTPAPFSLPLPGETAIYRHTLINPVSVTQDFTLTYISSPGYTVTVSTPSSRPTVTLPALGCDPLTVTVQIPPTTHPGQRYTTTITTTSELNGYETTHDITIVAQVHVFLPLILRNYPSP